jgi:hypothetical protein
MLLLLSALLLVACGGAAAGGAAAGGAAAGGATAGDEPPAAAPPTNGAPQLSAEATLLELGEVVNGVVVERDVAVRNSGDAPLVVSEVLTTCGCTTAALEPMTLAPGEAGNLHIAFDSGAHGPDLTGPVLRRVILVSNDPSQPEATIDLQATILPPADS